MELTPSHPIGVLELFSTSQQSIKLFADLVIDEVKEGRVDPLRIKALCKSMEAIAKAIDENTKDEQMKEAAKFGEKPFMNYGCEMHLTSTYTKYDYASCNDSVYNRLQDVKKHLDEQIKEREAFLKTMKESEILVDKATGEQYTAFPAKKIETMGIKTTIK